MSTATRVCHGFALALILSLLTTAHGQVLGRKSSDRVETFLRGRNRQPQGGATALAAARRQHLRLAASPRAADLTAAWTPVGPDQVANPVYGSVTGRITAIVIDPNDATGNTVYLGTTGGGVWKSVNAAGPAPSVTFTPLTDTLPVFDLQVYANVVPSLSIGSLAIAGSTVLAGTGDPNDATDSYYGGGILRSTDGGVTWTIATAANDGAAGLHYFEGLSVAALAASTVNPSVVVAALTQSAESATLGAGVSSNLPGLYVSTDAGITWQFAVVYDAAQVGNPSDQDVVQWVDAGQNDTLATSVVWNPVRQRFYAAIRNHGYYQSADGANWTRLANQPGAGITLAACPTLAQGTSTCPLGRGVLAVQPASGDLFALTLDAANNDQGLFEDVCAASSGSCSNLSVTFANQLNAAPLEVGSGSHVVLQGDYNLALAAAPSGSDTLLFAGTIDLYRCSLAAGCILRNTTNAQNGCATPAGVAGAQHAIALRGALLFTGNDGGLWRSTDGVAETGSACSASDAGHFDNLNAGIGSLAEIVSFAQDPLQSGTLLAGMGALGTAGTSSAFNLTGAASGAWTQESTGEGGNVAIDPVHPANWYLANGPAINIAACGKGSACGLADFAATSIGAVQVSADAALLHAPWLLDPQATTQLLAGTCRVWRGPASGRSAWTSADTLSPPFTAATATSCPVNAPVVRSLAVGGPLNTPAASPHLGSKVLYAGMEGSHPVPSGIYGHLFATTNAAAANGTTSWTDLALSFVANAPQDNHLFNPQAYDVSSIAADPLDPTGLTVYAALQGFPNVLYGTSNLYRSTDGGAHWLSITSNLPLEPANSVLVDPNNSDIVYVALDTGVYVTTAVASCATTTCWSIYGTALPNAPVTQLAAAIGMATGDGRTGELRAGTYGRGIWQIPLLSAVSPVMPGITLNPTALTFASQQAATQSSPQTITVTNSGNAPLTVTNITASAGFAETSDCLAAPIPAAATCSVSVLFAPTVAGTQSGTLTVYGNTAAGHAGATLNGTGTAPASIVLTPLALSFPTTTVGSTAGTENITVANTGGNTSALHSITVSGDFAIPANSCGTSLAPQTSCTVSLTFTPTASGSRSGTLTVVDDVGTQLAQLSGTGTSPPTDTLAPLALTFALQQIGSFSSARQVTLTNAGDQSLNLIHTATTGDFAAVNNCGTILPGHTTCALSVIYGPTSVGAVTGTLVVSDQFRSQTVSLTGTGYAGPGVSLTPLGGLTFPASAVGQQSPAQTVTLTNNGALPLAISATATTGDFSIGSNTCGASVSPGSSCILEVLFTATAGGPRSGTLTLTDNAPNSPQTVSLSGTGIDFSLTLDGPSSISLASGQTATYLLLLQSTAGVPGNATFTCSGLPTAAFCTVAPASVALGGSSATVITVTITTGQAHAVLEPWRFRGIPVTLFLALLIPIGCLARRRPSRLAALLAGVFLLAAAGCGSGRTIPASGSGGGTGSTSPVTPAGSYPITVAGSSGNLIRTANLTLIVQ